MTDIVLNPVTDKCTPDEFYVENEEEQKLLHQRILMLGWTLSDSVVLSRSLQPDIIIYLNVFALNLFNTSVFCD